MYYSECPFGGLADEHNSVYDSVRRLLKQLALDDAHYGGPDWNPLGKFLRPGQTVVLKPNFVAHRNRSGGDLYAVITHPSVIRAVADYCWIALKGEGRIIVADAPQYDCDWSKLMELTGLPKVAELYDGVMELLDLRSYWSRGRHVASQLEPLPGDPRGSVTVDLGRDSAFTGMDMDRVVGACYWRDGLKARHSGGHHEYKLSRTVIEADLVISLPKLKTHKKTGVTLNAKNLVGICTDKNCLPHYQLGPPGRGGDQYPDALFNPVEQVLIDLERWMYDHLLAPRVRALEYLHRVVYWLHNHTTRKLGLKVTPGKRLLDAGNWYGNDTAWLMVLDVHAAFDRVRKGRTFSIIDGVIGGEGNGPLAPDAVQSGLLFGGEDWWVVDQAALRVIRRLPFQLPPGWVGHMETIT
jgi:uncharacterized protein (DUF362 family)